MCGETYRGCGALHLLFLNAGWGLGKLIEVAVRCTFCFLNAGWGVGKLIEVAVRGTFCF